VRSRPVRPFDWPGRLDLVTSHGPAELIRRSGSAAAYSNSARPSRMESAASVVALVFRACRVDGTRECD
jgi:hypothetical protein